MYDRNAVQEAQKDGVCGIDSAVIIGLPALFDCGTMGFDWQTGVKAQSAQFKAMVQKQPVIGQFMEDVN